MRGSTAAAAGGTDLDPGPVPDYPVLVRLDGKRFVVVGAGLGIGRQTTHALALSGASVVCVDREEKRADAVAAETGGLAVTGDMTSDPDVSDLFALTRDRLGGLDGVVDIIGMARYPHRPRRARTPPHPGQRRCVRGRRHPGRRGRGLCRGEGRRRAAHAHRGGGVRAARGAGERRRARAGRDGHHHAALPAPGRFDRRGTPRRDTAPDGRHGPTRALAHDPRDRGAGAGGHDGRGRSRAVPERLHADRAEAFAVHCVPALGGLPAARLVRVPPGRSDPVAGGR